MLWIGIVLMPIRIRNQISILLPIQIQISINRCRSTTLIYSLCLVSYWKFFFKFRNIGHPFYSIAGPDPGSRAFFTPGSRIPKPFFESLLTIFGVKSTVIICEKAQIFFFTCSKINNFRFCDICGYKKSRTKKFPPHFFLLLLDLGSLINKNQDPGSGINVPRPLLCLPTPAKPSPARPLCASLHSWPPVSHCLPAF